MKVNILASGSSGNCIALTAGNSTILVDVGITRAQIEKKLLHVGLRAIDVKAIFITHAHGDHVQGISLANKYSIPVFAGEEEWKLIKGVDEELINNLYHGESKLFDYEGYSDWFEVIPFSTHHNSFDPLGYVIQTEHAKVSVCLDSGQIDSTMLETMKDSNVYIIESNHESRMVEASTYPDSVKARILSDVGHLSNKQTADTLSELVRGVGEQIYLTHLSSNNNMPALAEMTTVRALKQKGLDRDKHYKLEVI
ncbi:MBL fold metallo-hydrolase [Virgibacillus pantothenticus]|uniref:MBL fold metallo-hydrolase n=1 Tax=Virgibacillus pantothenticus TaxID=1473 RepID=UPI001C23D759|nr:MBL fold metallo-hydrolase [Virgibacillus pantothenticus]MBU8567611.1 MBL fold metallo-hydrolase [Virgibacillus pantothenticus]MBU8601399.1 MBL fold metallo-hydrolase [Virgibacillus pantothenticus]MBU8636216.1 MBL fold metallo-hydrolase [Virgibacillus pantothenticus]MBU8643736.1 MBL fold metallo-hydrolase [Virgibacillus pantothenticus]MBU8648008.1 MBL fold metallo-hydrolase [Virgibacillus pantothenticus]